MGFENLRIEYGKRAFLGRGESCEFGMKERSNARTLSRVAIMRLSRVVCFSV